MPIAIADGDLRERDAEAARIAVVRRAIAPWRVPGQDEPLQPRLEREVDRDRSFRGSRASLHTPDAPSRDLGTPGEQDEIARLATRRRDVLRDVRESSDRADHRGRPDVRAVRGVVQRHVPETNRHPSTPPCGGDPSTVRVSCQAPFGRSGLPMLRQSVIASGVAPMHTRLRVAPRRGRRTDERIDRGDAGLRIDRDRDAVSATLDPHERCVGTRTYDRVGANHLVVRPDRSLCATRSPRAEEVEQFEADLGGRLMRLSRSGCRARRSLRHR